MKYVTNLCLALAMVVFAAGQSLAGDGTYAIDASHSGVKFKVRHLGIASVPGKFNSYKGSVVLKDGKPSAFSATVDVKSVDTENAKRDKHLLAADFFDEAKFPTMTFKSKSITVKDKTMTVEGELTIRDKTKPVTLKGEFGGSVFVKMWNVHKLGFELEGEINRKEFGLSFNKTLPGGELMVGDKVKIMLAIEANMSPAK